MKTRVLFFFLLFMLAVVSQRSKVMAQTPAGALSKTDALHQLSDAQLQKIKSIRSASAKRAAPLAFHLAVTAKQIYDNMLREKEDEKLRRTLSAELTRTTSELLLIKGQSMRDVIGVLTTEQKQLVKSEMSKPGAPGDLMEVIEHTFNIPEK